MAAKLWLKDGKIVVNGSGQPIFCESCPCAICSFVDGTTPPALQFDVDSVVDGTCADCEWWNSQSFVLTQTEGQPCEWTLNTGTTDWPCASGSNNLIVQITSGLVTCTINVTGGGSVVFKKAVTTPIAIASIGAIPYFTAVGPAATVCDWTGATVTLSA